MQFTVTTVAMQDDDANIDKFYRTFVSDDGLEIRQNGRIGATGQIQTVRAHGSRLSASSAAETQLRSKLRKGYRGNAVAKFTYPDTKAPKDGEKDRARLMAQAFQASGLEGSAPANLLDGKATVRPVVRTEVQTVDGLNVLLEAVMAGINTAISDPGEGTVVYTQLRAQIDEAKAKLDQAEAYYETLEDLVMA